MLIPNIIIIRSIKHNLNYTKTITTVGMLAIVLGIMGTIIIPGYLHGIKAEAKTHSLSTSMSTSCNGETDEACQTIVCKNDKPCRNLDSNSDQTDMTTACEDDKPCRNSDSNSSQPQQTENATAAAQPQQADSNSNDDEMTSFLQTPPIPQIPDYSDYGFD
jgi:ABC-type lipoprotein release transport system permease subunit